MDTTIETNGVNTDSDNQQSHENSPLASSLCSRLLASDPKYELTRWELQARILADQPTADIAAAMGLPLSMVTAFEADSFDVRPQLKHPSIVLHKIIGIPLTEEWPASAGSSLMSRSRKASFFGGRRVNPIPCQMSTGKS